MEASLVQPTVHTRAPLSALTKLTMAALIGLALALAYLQLVVIAHFLPDLTVFAVIMAIVASRASVRLAGAGRRCLARS
jgi:hypothetical protein